MFSTYRLHFACIFACMVLSCILASYVQAQERNFQEFSLTLPEGWDGNEGVGLFTKDPNEYLLTLGYKDKNEEQYLAYISMYVLPNKPGKTSAESAHILAKQQANTSEPEKKGKFYVFTGIPRDKILVDSRATTYVRANKETLCIIIAKDPEKLGAQTIIESIKPQSKRTKSLFESGEE